MIYKGEGSPYFQPQLGPLRTQTGIRPAASNVCLADRPSPWLAVPSRLGAKPLRPRAIHEKTTAQAQEADPETSSA